MMGAMVIQINNLDEKQPLFREFCKQQNLKNGGSYNPIDYIIWCDQLTLIQQLEIIRKYRPDFKLQNCNL